MNSISSIGTLAATSSVRWVNDKTYQTSFNEHGNKWVERSLPFGYYRITDINHSNTTWKAEFYIDESIMINGRKATGYTNLVRYNNVKIGITCGKNSELLSTSITGRVSKSSGAEIANAAFDVLSAVSNWWSTGTAIANVFKAMKDSGKDIKLGGSAYTGVPSGTTSVGIAMQKNEYLFNNSYSSSSSTGVTTNSPAHYIIFQTNACSTSASGTASTYTKGCVTFQWDAFLNSDYTKLDTAKKKSFEVNYYSKY